MTFTASFLHGRLGAWTQILKLFPQALYPLSPIPGGRFFICRTSSKTPLQSWSMECCLAGKSCGTHRSFKNSSDFLSWVCTAAFHACAFTTVDLTMAGWKYSGKKYPSGTEHIQICFSLPERHSARLICRAFLHICRCSRQRRKGLKHTGDYGRWHANVSSFYTSARVSADVGMCWGSRN